MHGRYLKCVVAFLGVRPWSGTLATRANFSRPLRWEANQNKQACFPPRKIPLRPTSTPQACKNGCRYRPSLRLPLLQKRRGQDRETLEMEMEMEIET
jgi:hypothetical protein